MSYLNLGYGPARHESFVAQWLEHPTGVGKVIGSIPVGDSDFFFVLCSWHVDHTITRGEVFIVRAWLHDTGATFAPTRVHSGSLSWLYICLHDTTTTCNAGASYPGVNSFRRLRYESQRYHVNAKRPPASVWNRSAGGLEQVAPTLACSRRSDSGEWCEEKRSAKK